MGFGFPFAVFSGNGNESCKNDEGFISMIWKLKIVVGKPELE